MKKFSYNISELALEDLNSIWEYTFKNWSRNQANIYYNEIFNSIDEICSNSESGKIISQGHRRINIQSHMIVYKIVNNQVCIDRILHQRMDVDRHI